MDPDPDLELADQQPLTHQAAIDSLQKSSVQRGVYTMLEAKRQLLSKNQVLKKNTVCSGSFL